MSVVVVVVAFFNTGDILKQRQIVDHVLMSYVWI